MAVLTSTRQNWWLDAFIKQLGQISG